MSSPEEVLLPKAFETLAIPWRDEQINKFSRYLSLLKKWSHAYNLTSLTDDNDILIKHFVDSVAYLKVIPEHITTLLDVGSGAGFPGLPIKIMRPAMHVYLLEPSRKKTAFLKHVANALLLPDTYILRCRIEEYPCSRSDIPSRFQAVVTRALFSASEFFNLASPLCEKNGLIILSKGPSYREELKEMDEKRIAVREAGLSDLGLKRYLLTVTP